jgi:hypothetical protein
MACSASQSGWNCCRRISTRLDRPLIIGTIIPPPNRPPRLLSTPTIVKTW